MADKYVTFGTNLVVGSLSGDIGKLVDSLSSAVLSVKNCREKCKALKEKVDSVYHALHQMENEMVRHPEQFNPKDHTTNLMKFFMVVKDCIAQVKRHNGRNFIVRWILAFKIEGDFDALDQRLEQCMRFFKLDLSVQTVVTTIEIKGQLESLMDSTLQGFQEIQYLLKRNSNDPALIESFSLQGIVCGQSIYGGYMIAGKWTTAKSEIRDVILVSSQQQKNEVAIMKLLSESESILQFYGTWSEGANQYLVMERPSREMITLDEWIKSKNDLKDKDNMELLNEWRVKRLLALELTMAVAYVHCAGILHRSLRSPHVFLTDDLRPKLFGFFAARKMVNPSEKRWTPLEQIRWAAPEILPKDRPEFSQTCDIFSLGVIMWEIITDDYPFSDIDSATKLLAERTKKKRMLRFPSTSSPIHQSEFYKDFCQVSLDCMNENPNSRPELKHVIDRLDRLAPEDVLNLV
ncbi:hypothetical protein O6H91_12G047300 [Diphasiastrum complanatum]|uniref:Uncharacterized protein n=1 Tax=Diphasiastrum complanatum TaxID=34168 RepID=A0ACC2C1C6_DIPCM|nr:hypothetical protein O6H91_12G047300 [Diphasiastrum complanatum]